MAIAPAAIFAEHPRMRLSEFVKDPSRVESLKRGVRVMKSRKPSDPRSWFFQAAIHVMVENQRGVLAKVASEIAEAASNIDAISMEDDRSMFTTMHFVLEVANRQHLARVMRALRRLPDVKKISRVKE